MGPGGRGLRASGDGVPGLHDARRWRERLERAWGLTLHDSVAPSRLHLPGFVGELEQGLGLIDFPEVTVEDRITFLEAAVAWQVRRALRAGRFDLAIRIQAFGAKRVMELVELHARARSRRRLASGILWSEAPEHGGARRMTVARAGCSPFGAA